MEKYGVVVRVSEELLKSFLSARILSRIDNLGNVVKSVILENWNISYASPVIECDAQRELKTDTYLFRIRSNRPVPGLFHTIEGMEYPTSGWFLRELETI
jgi:hypothetical protein